MVIISVGQEYESTKSKQDYWTGIDIIYSGRGILIDIGKVKDNFNKDKKLKW